MKYRLTIFIVALAVLSACSDVSMDDATSSLFSDRCIIDYNIECNNIGIESGNLIVDMKNEHNNELYLGDASISILDPERERIDVSCDFNTYDIDPEEEFKMTCELDSDILEEVEGGSFRFEISALEGRNLEETSIEGDMYISS